MELLMLGPVGPIASNFLRSRGFIITRPTEVEKAFTRSFWKDWFSTDPKLFASVYEQNRATLSSVKIWISDETLAGSLWRYGVPVGWNESHTTSVDRTGLLDVESEITAADLLSFVARRLGSGVSYLEIGVSVGKNLLQVDRQLSNAKLVGLDIEELNPILRDQFSTCVNVEEPSSPYLVETLSKGLVEKRTSLKRLTSRDRGNTFEYLSGDQFLDSTWALLSGKSFNLIFSDGVHTAEALRKELYFLLKYKLIDQNRCVMFWDDLQSVAMQSAFLENARTLCKMFERDDSAISLFQLHGSYGMKRLMGMFSSLSEADL
jgi:hypothetical protein